MAAAIKQPIHELELLSLKCVKTGELGKAEPEIYHVSGAKSEKICSPGKLKKGDTLTLTRFSNIPFNEEYIKIQMRESDSTKNKNRKDDDLSTQYAYLRDSGKQKKLYFEHRSTKFELMVKIHKGKAQQQPSTPSQSAGQNHGPDGPGRKPGRKAAGNTAKLKTAKSPQKKSKSVTRKRKAA